MQLTLNKTSGVRKIGEKAIEQLSQIEAEALAYAQSVGTKATATAADVQGWRFSAICAVGIQRDILEKDGDEDGAVWHKRIDALKAHRDQVVEALKSSVLTQHAADLGLARHVQAPKAKKGEDVIDSPQALMMKAQKRLENYYNNRLIAAWEARILIKYDETANGDIFPESAGKLADRVKNAKRTNAPATGASDLKGALGKVAGDLGAVMPANMTLETSAACKAILTGAYACILQAIAGNIGHEDALGIGQSLQDAALEASGDALEAMPEGETEQAEASDESREAEAA